MPSTLGLLSVACTAGAVVVLARWARNRHDELGRPHSLPVISVSLLLLVAVAAMIPTAQRRIQEDRLARAAGQIVGYEVEVHCQTTSGALVDAGPELGFVRFNEYGDPEASTMIKREPCRALAGYLRSDKSSPTRAQAVAVHVLTHEAMHMRGETDEAAAECQAMQRDLRMATLLGASPAAARRLARLYWFTVYPDMPEEYRTTDCVAGGPLDEQLNSGIWN